jgi:hypothetical protein
MVENYNRFAFDHPAQYRTHSPLRQRASMDLNLHSLPRRLIELRIEHADLDNLIDQAMSTLGDDELSVRRLKKRRLLLRDQIARLEAELDPPEPA